MGVMLEVEILPDNGQAGGKELGKQHTKRAYLGLSGY